MKEKNLSTEINEPIGLYLNLDKFEEIYIVCDNCEIKLNKSKILMFLELFREYEVRA